MLEPTGKQGSYTYDPSVPAGTGGGGGSGSGGTLAVEEDSQTGALTKTWQEIFDALSKGWYVAIVGTLGEDIVTTEQVFAAGLENDEYAVTTNQNTFKASSKDGYPVLFIDPVQ